MPDTRLQRLVIDPQSSASLAGRARQRRWRELLRRFPALSDMHVLDLGGVPSSWLLAPARPAHVTTVNLQEHAVPGRWVEHVVGDACDLPRTVRTRRFDLVFSNSLLEHVGGHVQRQRFAASVHAGADRHWVQTPYRYFPVEPHWVFPGMQFLPHSGRVWVSRHWHHGHIRTDSRAAAEAAVAEVELVGIAQMRSYFPSSVIWPERLLGLPKSLVAVAT